MAFAERRRKVAGLYCDGLNVAVDQSFTAGLNMDAAS